MSSLYLKVCYKRLIALEQKLLYFGIILKGLVMKQLFSLDLGSAGTLQKNKIASAAAASDKQIRAMLEAGLSMGEAVVPRTAPKDSAQLSLFGG